MITQKRNWSAPGPDRIVNYWWKSAHSLHEGVGECLQAISKSIAGYPIMWFSQRKTTLIPKPCGFASENQRPITCLNTGYKWFPSYLLGPKDRLQPRTQALPLRPLGKDPCERWSRVSQNLGDRIFLLLGWRGAWNICFAEI